MSKFPLPAWQWSKWMLHVNHYYPHRVKDFAKSFSENQMAAKSWLVEHLKMHPINDGRPKTVWVLGSWYGTILIPLLQNNIKNIEIHMVDYDPETLKIAEFMFDHKVKTHCMDVNFDLEQLEADIIINTSCEHMYPMTDYNFKGLCVFQTNNFREETAHINCVDTLDDFKQQLNMKRIDVAKEMMFHRFDQKHKRFMIIGEK